jgi:hypothetical protein
MSTSFRRAVWHFITSSQVNSAIKELISFFIISHYIGCPPVKQFVLSRGLLLTSGQPYSS